MAKVLCIEVGLSVIKMVEMDYQVKKPKIYKCVEVTTPSDAIKDGYLNPEKIEVLKNRIKEALANKKIRTKRVIFSVFSGKIISREIMIPAVKQHQISAVVTANAYDYFPIELEQYKISHLYVNTIKDGENIGRHKVIVMAVEKTLLEGYDLLATELGLRLVDIDYTGNSVYQIMKQNAGAGAIMVVKMEEEHAIITILQQGTLILQRNVKYALGRLEGEKIRPEEALESLQNTMMRVMEFHASHEGNGKIEQIYIMGEQSRDEKIADDMAFKMEIPCRIVDTIRGVTIPKKVDVTQWNLFAGVIGAGIASVGLANEKEKKRHETNYVSACILMIIFFGVLIGSMFVMSLIPYYTALQEQKLLQKKEETYAPAQVVYEQYIATQKLYTHLEYGHLLTRNSNDSILSFLEELEKKLPTSVELTEFSSDDEMCVMTMRVDDKETAAGVIKTLREFSSLKTVSVESIAEESAENGDVVSLESTDTKVKFTISCYYNVAEPVSPEVAEAQASTVQE